MRLIISVIGVPQNFTGMWNMMSHIERGHQVANTVGENKRTYWEIAEPW